jgi:Cytochrome P460
MHRHSIAWIPALALLWVGCAQGWFARGPGDAAVKPPADYRSWARFVPTVDRHDIAQVREIYVNDVGAAAKAGQPFPNGTLFVMEIYTARPHADGAPAFDPSGRLVKGPLSKLYVMAKGAGWGGAVQPPELRTGDWVYSAFQPDLRTPTDDAIAACRGCHLPLAKQDFVPRYDEHFAPR